MRRILRPSRAIDPSLPISILIRHRVSPSPCRSVFPHCTHLRTTSAAFSTTPSHSFILSGKQDKKKHQQFVRRWQKRLLGDSEPIGAHVDPYDPTSPVRVAPEEQGEEEEVLLDERHGKGIEGGKNYEQSSDGRFLRHVGGQKWREQMVEAEMAKEFEKLTLRTYTPMDLRMADEIEDLTGTPYTLRDENLFMAQDYHEATGKPYTELSWGRHNRITELPKLRARFQQAVAEVYTLKEAGLNMDLSTFANRGVYKTPSFVKDIKFYKTKSGELALSYPKFGSAEHLVRKMQEVPELGPPAMGEPLEVSEGAEELIVEQLEQPFMDPNTHPTKRAALVKQDEDKKLFDFMSNRPVPRTKPVETQEVEGVVEKTEAIEPEPQAKAPLPSVHIEAAVSASQTALAEMRHSVLDSAAQRVENNVSALRKAVRSGIKALDSSSISTIQTAIDVKWRDVPLTDVAVKFALTKRLFQLTGLHISDPHLTSAHTLGDLYGYLCAAAKPKPAKLYSILNVEGQKARTQAKLQTSIFAQRKKQDLGDLLTMRNVELQKKKISSRQKRVTTGLDKVVQYAFAERGLDVPDAEFISARPSSDARVREGTRAIPEFGRVVSHRDVNILKRRQEKGRKIEA